MPRTGLYVPLDVCFPDDERIEQVGLEGAGLYAFALCVAKRTLSDGRVSRVKLTRLGASDALIDRLIDVGLLSADGADAVRITAWLGHNDGADKIADRRARDAARKRQARASRPRDVQADSGGSPGGPSDTEKSETESKTETETAQLLPSQSETSTGHPQGVDDSPVQGPVIWLEQGSGTGVASQDADQWGAA